MSHRSPFRCALVVLSLPLLAGCGYHFVGTGSRLPPEIRTISLGPIRNNTREVRIDKQLLESLEDEIAGHGRLEVVPAGQGDCVLTGMVRDYVSRPVAFSSLDEAVQNQASVPGDLQLRPRDNGKLLWKTNAQRQE